MFKRIRYDLKIVYLPLLWYRANTGYIANTGFIFNSYRIVDMFFQVVGIMRVNVEKVLERDQKLSELDNRAGNFFKLI